MVQVENIVLQFFIFNISKFAGRLKTFKSPVVLNERNLVEDRVGIFYETVVRSGGGNIHGAEICKPRTLIRIAFTIALDFRQVVGQVDLQANQKFFYFLLLMAVFT